MTELRTYMYSLFQFVPGPGRHEAANLGVVVVSDPDRQVESKFFDGLGAKVRVLAPGANIRNLRLAIWSLRSKLRSVYQPTIYGEEDPRITTSQELRSLASTMSGQLQLTEVQQYRASSISAAVEELFQRFVVPLGPTTPTPRGMTRAHVRELVERTIRDWGPTVQIREGVLDGHNADFWLTAGQPEVTIAAFIAIPPNPVNIGSALSLCDSIPTIARAHLQENPYFKVIAVLPPNGQPQTQFARDASARLKNSEGVLTVRADQLEAYRDRILPTPLLKA